MNADRGWALGIDLGTTYSTAACLNGLGRPETLPNQEGDKLTPSVVLFDGAEAIVGKEALRAIGAEADLIAECAKRDLGQRLYHKVLGGRQYPPEAIQGLILNKLRVDARLCVGSSDRAVITVPAYFDEVRRKATQDAGYIAGLEVMDILNEPTAAAVAFGFQRGILRPDGFATRLENILVYDLGGGTFDVTVMEISGSEYTALATDGDVRLGGRDWDQRLMDYVAEECIRQLDIDPRDDPNAAGRLWRECEDAKRTLSARDRAHIVCDLAGPALRVEVTRQAFEEMTQDLLDRTAFTVRQTLMAAGLSWNEISHILLVGGSTRMPAVVDMLRQQSGMEPDGSISPDEAVAHGAALHAGLLARRDQQVPFSITNVNSHSLGVVGHDATIKRPRNAVLIPRNTPLPVTAKRIFRTKRAGQRSIRVQIVEGESTRPKDCTEIGLCTIRDLPPDLPDDTPVEVQFHYQENGRLRVVVRVAGGEVRHEIARENSLSQEQLDSWREFVTGKPPLSE